jgi:hypothetical protein
MMQMHYFEPSTEIIDDDEVITILQVKQIQPYFLPWSFRQQRGSNWFFAIPSAMNLTKCTLLNELRQVL